MSKKKNYTIKEQFEYANSFVGKTVSIEERVTISNVGCIGDISEYHEDDDGEEDYLIRAQTIIDEQGFIFCYQYDDNEHIIFIHPSVFLLEEAPPIVNINGFQAQEFEDYIEFGCAKFNKEILRAAKVFLEKVAEVEYNAKTNNRLIESVQLGSGKFYLDDLKNLLWKDEKKEENT